MGRAGKLKLVLPNHARKLTLTLKPGRYLLIDNLPGHFQRGMYARFTVR